jgi:hypothetical protein
MSDMEESTLRAAVNLVEHFGQHPYDGTLLKNDLQLFASTGILQILQPWMDAIDEGIKNGTIPKTGVRPQLDVDKIAAEQSQKYGFEPKRLNDFISAIGGVRQMIDAKRDQNEIDAAVALVRRYGEQHLKPFIDKYAIRQMNSVIGEYAPGVIDVKQRVLAGRSGMDPLQTKQWFDDIDTFMGAAKIHHYTMTDVEDVERHLAAQKHLLGNAVDEVQANIRRIKAMYQSGPIHLIAFEQQMLAYRVNKSIEGMLGGLPGALQPATISALHSATPYCWSPEPVEAVVNAAKSLPLSAQPSETSLGPIAGYEGAGWWWFERPIPVQTTSDVDQPVVALLWRREVHDVFGLITWFSAFVIEEVEVMGRMQYVPTPTTAWLWPDQYNLGEMLEKTRENYQQHHRQGNYGANTAGEDVTQNAIEWFSRFWMSGGLWLKQRVLQRSSMRVPRQPGRHLARTNNLATVPLVEVVHLRRAETPPSDQILTPITNVNWSCRWIVAGHWRNAWFPSIEQHIPIWINPFIKGPQDAPLKTSIKIYAVDR